MGGFIRFYRESQFFNRVNYNLKKIFTLTLEEEEEGGEEEEEMSETTITKKTLNPTMYKDTEKVIS